MPLQQSARHIPSAAMLASMGTVSG